MEGSNTADSFTHAINLGVNLDILKVTNAKALADIIEERLKVATEFLTKIDSAAARRNAAVKGYTDDSKKGSGSDKEGLDSKMAIDALGSISKGTQSIASGGMNILKTGLGILTDVFERIKAASPLLQAVETLFNLAMQLFFMPLGTKLATVLIPSIVELVDGVMQIWEGFEDKSLGEILADTIRIGAEIFGEFFKDIGSELISQGGILSAIGTALTMLGNFIEDDGEKVIGIITKIMTFIVENLPAILGTIVGLLVLSKSLQLVQIAATVAAAFASSSHTPWGIAVGGAAVASVGAIAAGLGVGNMLAFADGGYVPATPGGIPALVAEGGEGEYIVPESKKNAFAKSVLGGSSGNTFNIYVNGYTDTDLEDKIVNVLNEQTNLSRLRSGF